MGVIKIEGKSVTLDDAIIDAGIPAIKAALSVDFPDVENADIEIIGSKAPGVVRSASVVKRGTGKGNISLTGSRSLAPVKNQSVEEHVAKQAADSIAEMFRRLSLAPDQQSVVLNLARTECACGSSEQHPDQHWIVLVGGPFTSAENALDGLEQAVQQREQILTHDRSLHRRLKSSDITGGQS